MAAPVEVTELGACAGVTTGPLAFLSTMMQSLRSALTLPMVTNSPAFLTNVQRRPRIPSLSWTLCC